MSEKTKRNAVPLKEKVIAYYEDLFQAHNPLDENKQFWEEFFLLKSNIEALEQTLQAVSDDTLPTIKDNINELFCRSISVLEEPSSLRTVNAIQTMCGLVKGVAQRSHDGFTLIDTLIGSEEPERHMQRLIVGLQKILVDSGSPVSLKNMCLRYLLTIVTLADNISQNSLVEYLMINNIFDALVQILSDSKLRMNHGSDAIVLINLLVQYRKYESTNPYAVNLSILSNDLVLNGWAKIILLSVLDYNREFRLKIAEQKPSGFMASVASMVGNVFGGDDLPKVKIKPDLTVLLALYEAMHVNRHFVSALTTSHAAASVSSGSLPSLLDIEQPAVQPACEVKALRAPEEIVQPTNLLAAFMEYASIIFFDVKDSENLKVTRLCFIILTCVTEDQYANTVMHDANMNFVVPIHRMPMRHRKNPQEKNTPSLPLACFMIDLQVEFIQSHMMKGMPAELYLLSLGILHRVICYQKKTRTRLVYPWKQLWTALINLCKFLLSHETTLLKICNIFYLAIKAISIFNLFITFGDSFLAILTTYDELYYEIIRNYQVFLNLHTLAMRHSSGSGKYKEDATRFIHCLANVRAVINHFNPKVDAWASANHVSSLTEDQVLAVVQENYDSLTLKIHESLDQYDRYSEKPREMPFFINIVRTITKRVREQTVLTHLEQSRLLKEFSSFDQ